MVSSAVIQGLHIFLLGLAFVAGIVGMALAEMALTDLLPMGDVIGAKQIQLANLPLGKTVLFMDDSGHYEFEPASDMDTDYSDDDQWRQWGFTEFGVDYDRTAAAFDGNVTRRDIDALEETTRTDIGDDSISREGIEVSRQGHNLFLDVDDATNDDLLVRAYSYLEDSYGIAGAWLYDAAERHAIGEFSGDTSGMGEVKMMIGMTFLFLLGVLMAYIVMVG